MSKTKNLIHLVSIALLFLWGAVLLYFYASERLAHYLPPDGIFRPMVLFAGIGMVILGLFNLATTQYKEADCCGHDHSHDHDHGDGGHDHSHDHEHKHDASCGHDHEHDHAHKHEHHHDHAHDHGAAHNHDHGHGILEESKFLGRTVAILILAAPVTWAAIRTPDQYSANAIVNKGLYNQNYASTTRADQFSLKKEKAPAKTDVATKTQTTNVADQPPDATTTKPAPGAPADVAKPSGAAETKSFGTFTLADLEAQVPKSKEGNFILEVPELFYTAGDKEVQSVLKGQSVETIAQVLPEKVNNEDGKRLRIFRMLVQCCAADARPYSIPVEFTDKAPEIKEMTWVKMIGKMNFKQEGGQTVPVLEAISWKETTAPDDAMMY